MDQDPNNTLPLDFYGLNYLGRPANVSVQGESPAPSGAGAVATGAMGTAPSSGSVPSATTPSGAPPAGAPGSSAAQTALEALALGKETSTAASKLTDEKTPEIQGPPSVSNGVIAAPGVATLNPPQLTDQSGFSAVNPITREGLTPGQVNTLAEQEASVGTGAAEEAASSGASLAGGTVAAAEAAQLAAQLAGAKIPTPITAGESALNIGTAGLSGVPSILSAGKLTVPDIAATVLGFGGFIPGINSLFGGKPPAETFPSQSWAPLAAQVSSKLPPKLTIPEGATAEQKQAIQLANDVNAQLASYYGPNPPPALRSGDKQSAQSWESIWQSTIQTAQKNLEAFVPVYNAAIKAIQDATPAPTPAKTGPAQSSVLPGGFYKGDQKLPVGQ